MHTINLEQLATVLELNDDGSAHPDMLLGTDSHTPMINGIGVMGWGVGGLEAETVMFGQPASLAFPEVVGVTLTGSVPAGVLSSDLALDVTHRLRELGVTGSFVEFFGPGLASLTADDRAVVANMSPEYGAATGFFPVDAATVSYLERTGRPARLTRTVEPVFRRMGLWFDPRQQPHFDRQIEIDLSKLTPVVAGPRRPQDRRALAEVRAALEATIGRGLDDARPPDEVPDGAVGIAAIASCTNTSDPRLLIAAGLLARKARARGLGVKPWVKTSFAPGSPSARDYLARAGLLDDLSAFGYDIVGFGCTTCIGNSGPLPAEVEEALGEGRAVAAVLSGNRNFPGRVHPKLDLGFLASPPMIIAFAIRGVISDDLATAPLGHDPTGAAVHLDEIWPTPNEVDAAMTEGFAATDVPAAFARASQSEAWKRLEAPNSPTFPWDPASRYLRRPPFASASEPCRLGRYEASALLVLGDDITTDHISPASAIPAESEAGRWLVAHGADPSDLNVYAAYRGNWEVMLRGAFTNALARNYLAEGLDAGWTVLDDGELLPAYEAAARRRSRGESVVILAGERYGMGSSRDWAAKAAALLGARAVIARSFERIHRINLIGMGVLPVEIVDDFVPAEAGIGAGDRFALNIPAADLTPRAEIAVEWLSTGRHSCRICCRAAVDTRNEVEMLKAGGALPMVLRAALATGRSSAQARFGPARQS